MVFVGKLLGKLHGVGADILRKDFHNGLKRTDKVIRVNLLHNFKIHFEYVFESRLQELLCNLIFEHLTEGQSCRKFDRQFFNKEALINTIHCMLDVFCVIERVFAKLSIYPAST